ncbi:T9SS C-terminal target domain-containing protein [Pontibacter korlensis]|uniref:DUF3494 domain-containing protein n=1 Tax=Pontibacter korlensis TaxID=400092 RepID=A0A0E3ZFP2_9BACT|nr:T9SS C-terminal target domain-containing protein [Pontibacter korlensis]AKD02998.1 hypothetical protein PKOR_07490 [Pontibacter korlensis]
MIKHLLLTFLLLIGSITLSFAQSEQAVLGQAEDYAILAVTRVTNQGDTDVYGDLGVTSGAAIVDRGNLKVDGDIELGSAAAKNAFADAQAVYNNFSSYPNPNPLFSSTLGNYQRLAPGVHKVNTSANLRGGLILDAQGDPSAKFVIIINGNLTSTADKTYVNLINGAQPKNVFWVVEGSVDTGKTSLFQGTVLAKGNIKFGGGGVVIGRAISLTGEVGLETNLVFMPNIIIANLSVQKEAEDKEYTVGSEITYTIRATNLGPDNAAGVVVKENFPAGLQYVRVESASKGAYDANTNQWVIGSLAVGEVETLRITFRIVSPGNIINKVAIIGDNPDPSPDDDEDEHVIELPDIGVTKIVNGKSTYLVGDVVRYTIVVTNKGNGEEQNVVASDKLPEGLEYVSHTASTGTYNPATGLFHIPLLAENTSATLTIDARLIKAGNVRNVASIIGKDQDPNNPTDPNNPGGDYHDSDPDNDEDDEEVVVTCPAPTVSLTAAQTTVCASTSNLTFTATPIIGAEYTFELPQGWTVVSQANNIITVNVGPNGGASVVRVTVKDQCNNTASAEANVQVTGAPVVPEISGVASVCFNSNGITLEAANVAEGLTYEWSVGANLEIVGANNGASVVVKTKAGNLLGGTVTLTVTNSCGLTSTGTKVITVVPAPEAPVAIVGQTDVCEGKQVTFRTAAVTGATSYTWTLPAGWEFAPGSATNTNQVTVVAGENGGTIEVIASNDCSSSTAATLNVTVTNAPEAPTAVAGVTNPCAGSEQTYTVEEVEGAIAYVWTVPSGWTVIGNRTGRSIRVRVGNNAGAVTAAVTNKCYTGAVVSLEVTPNTIPAVPGEISSPDAGVCAVSTGNMYSIAAVPGATSYLWEVPAGWTITSGEGTTSITVTTANTGGTVKVRASNECGTSAERTLTVRISTIPTVPVAISGESNLCEGTVATYSVRAVDGAASYNWSVPATGGWEIVEGQGTARVRVRIGTTAGNVEVAAANACGESSKATLAITVNSKPAAPAAITGDNGACIGTRLTYSIPAVTGATGYEWAVPATWNLVSGQGTRSIVVEVGREGGNIAVAVTNECGTGEATTKAVAPVLAPVAPSITGNNNVCEYSQELTYTISNPEEGATYIWSLPQGWSFVSENTGTSVVVNAGTEGGAISVVATNGCGETAGQPLAVEVFAPPVEPGQITDNSNVCDGLVFSIAPVAGVSSYNWTVSSGFTITSGQGTTTITVKADRADARGTVTVAAINGPCSSMEVSAPIDASLADGNLNFPKAFSPNGDGTNDTWHIKNLEKFPNNEVTIFNRWGSEVYKAKSYQNNWSGKGLEQGTYFYKVRVTVCDGVVKEFTGYTTIFR